MFALVREESPLGCWTVTSYAPATDDPLVEVVERVWLFRGTTALPRERVFPNGRLEIVLQLDAAYRPVRGVLGEPFPPLSIGGMRTGALTIEGCGRPVRVLGIVLRPGGAAALLRTSLGGLTDLDLDLHDVIGAAAGELGERCASEHSDRACVTASLGWIRSRLGRAREPAQAVVRAVAEIEAHHGDVVIERLEALSGASRARFAAGFRDHVGVTPKRFARILRFRHALDLLEAGTVPIGGIAAQTGYYDQPHLNAEFRIHAGMTPHEFQNAQRYPNSTSLAEQIFQDTVAESA